VKSFRACTAIVGLLASTPVIANEAAVAKQAMNNLAHEFTNCWAYYRVAIECMSDTLAGRLAMRGLRLE
jgi:hypothetical protein